MGASSDARRLHHFEVCNSLTPPTSELTPLVGLDVQLLGVSSFGWRFVLDQVPLSQNDKHNAPGIARG